ASGLDRLQRGRAIDVRLAHAEQVQIGTVEDHDAHEVLRKAGELVVAMKQTSKLTRRMEAGQSALLSSRRTPGPIPRDLSLAGGGSCLRKTTAWGYGSRLSARTGQRGACHRAALRADPLALPGARLAGTT